MSTPEKQAAVAELAKVIEGKSLVFVNYAGINFPDLLKIRKDLKAADAKLTVIKNTLLRIGLASKKIEPPAETFTGMSALAVIGGDFAAAAKALADAEKLQKVTIRGGWYEGQVVDAAFVKKIANVPSREVLYGMLVGVLQAPASMLVASLNQVAEKKGDGSPAAAA